MSARRAADSGPGRPFPRIVPRNLAAPGSLAGDALAGVTTAAGLFPTPVGHLPALPAGRAIRGNPALPAAAFTTTSRAAAERLARILAGEGAVVTTGQQPGLFLGPLYTLYKALTAVRVADEVERRTGQPALAVFWVASDDHDWEEVASCRIVDGGGDLVSLRIDPPAGWVDRSVGQAPLPAEVTALLQRLEAEGGGAVSGAAPRWLSDLCDAYLPGRSFGDAFVQALRSALDGLDLAILDSAHPAVRSAAAPLYRRVLETPAPVVEAMGSGLRNVREAGYDPILTPPPEGLQIFFDDGVRRSHILRSAGRFDVGGRTIARDDLFRRLDQQPVAFTPAAALRPVLESRLLPVAAAVLGPGEIGYWAQLAPLFGSLEVRMPCLFPRDAWVLVEPRIDRLLEKLEVDVDTIELGGKGVDDRWVARSRPPRMRDGIVALEQSLAAGFEQLSAAIAAELPGLRSAAGKAEHRARQALDDLVRTIDARVREREHIALGQAARVRAHLMPDGRPQERTVAAAQFLARHGGALVRDLLAASRVAGPEGRD